MTAAPNRALFHLENQPPTPVEHDLDEYQSALCDYPPEWPTEGQRLVDGFAILMADEDDD